MIRQIIIPQENTSTLNLPNEMIGKEIEVIAFEIELNNKETTNTLSDVDKLKKNQSIFDGVRVKRNGYKFNRDDANDYE